MRNATQRCSRQDEEEPICSTCSSTETTESLSHHHRLDVTAAAVLVDDENTTEEDVEMGSLPVIELPAHACCSSGASNVTDCVAAAAAARERIDVEAQIEPPQEGTIPPHEMEQSVIAHMVVHDTTAADLTLSPDPGCTTTRTTEEELSSRSALGRRAEFISATVVKESEDTPLGIELISENKGHAVIISAIHEKGIMANTPFKKGDRLLSVNTKRCYIMDAKAVLEFMAGLEGKITLVIHNAGGDPNLVESMITRTRPDAPCGLGMVSSGRHHLRISNIHSDGFFYESLLNVGDPIVSINGEPCEYCDAHDAGDIIARSGKFITVKSRTLMETGVVVAAFSTANSTGSTIPHEIVNALARARKENEVSSKKVISLALIAVAFVSLLLFSTLIH